MADIKKRSVKNNKYRRTDYFFEQLNNVTENTNEIEFKLVCIEDLFRSKIAKEEVRLRCHFLKQIRVFSIYILIIPQDMWSIAEFQTLS